MSFHQPATSTIEILPEYDVILMTKITRRGEATKGCFVTHVPQVEEQTAISPVSERSSSSSFSQCSAFKNTKKLTAATHHHRMSLARHVSRPYLASRSGLLTAILALLWECKIKEPPRSAVINVDCHAWVKPFEKPPDPVRSLRPCHQMLMD
jgi:hypothetical protein